MCDVCLDVTTLKKGNLRQHSKGNIILSTKNTIILQLTQFHIFLKSNKIFKRSTHDLKSLNLT